MATTEQIEELRNALGGSALGGSARGALLTEPDAIRPYTLDHSRAVPEGLPLAVVLAESTADVQTTLAWATRTDTPVSVRGAGTGVVGGAVSYRGGIVLSLERMNKILEIDAANRLAVVQPGVVTADLDRVAGEHGLFYPPDPASADQCTIGGNIATNAGGLRCVAHGVTGDAVAALEVVLADGRVLRTGAKTRKNVVGYDMTRLFVGSEGTLGVVTEATLRLKPNPEGNPVFFRADFDRVPAAGRAVIAITRSTAEPEVLELLDAMSLRVIEEFRPTGSPIPEGAMLVGEVRGRQAEERANEIAQLCAEAGAVHTSVSADETLLARRRLSNPALSARGLKISCDVGVPIAALADMLEGIEGIAAATHRRISTVAHAGDGNLHSTVETDDAPASVAGAEAALEDITRLALSLGGTITGEHGIGSVKHDELALQLDPVSLEMQRSLKTVFDPRGILSPGRGI